MADGSGWFSVKGRQRRGGGGGGRTPGMHRDRSRAAATSLS